MAEAEVANRWIGYGPVGKEPKLDHTSDGQTVCSFQISAPTRDGNRTVWVRVNVYDPPLVRYVRKHIRPGTVARVSGELMNRKYRGRGPQLTEVRAHEISVQ